MEKIINKLFEAETGAHKLVEKAKLDKDWSAELCAKEFSKIRDKRIEEMEAMLNEEAEAKRKAFETEIEQAKQKYETDKMHMEMKYANLSTELLNNLFAEVIKTEN